MPRTYIRKKESQVDYQKVAECVKAIREQGLSIRNAAAQFSIDKSVIHRHLKASYTQMVLSPPGRMQSLPPNLEAEIAGVAKTAAAHGFGLQKKELKEFTQNVVIQAWELESECGTYLKKHCQFVNKCPSDEWVTDFMSRHHLSLRLPSMQEKVRKEAASDPFLIFEFYNILKNELDNLGILNKPSHIFNCDESAFFVDPVRGRIVSETGVSVFHSTAGSGRECITAMATVNAAGKCLPPLVIFKAKNLYSAWQGSSAVPGTTYAVSDNGWMQTNVFVSWFDTFLRQVKERPLLLVFDGHRTHIGLDLIKCAKDNNVSLLKLPSHTTHCLQPLDVACFKPLKGAWDQALLQYQRMNGFRHLQKREFVDILCSVWKKGLSVDNIQAGFQKTGIYPFNCHMYPVHLFDQGLLLSYHQQHPAPANFTSLTVCTTSTGGATSSTSGGATSISGGATASASSNVTTSNSGGSIAILSPTGLSLSQSVFVSKFLNPYRQMQPANQVASKRRKINRSAAVITHEEFTVAMNDLKNPAPSKKSCKPVPMKNTVPDTSSSSSGSVSDCENDDEINLPAPLIKRSTQILAQKSLANINIKPGEYVIVQYNPEKMKKADVVYYVGLVIKQDESGTWQVSCLRRSGTSMNKFVFPEAEDLYAFSSDKIVQHLCEPKKVRNVYHFCDDMSDFHKSLR